MCQACRGEACQYVRSLSTSSFSTAGWLHSPDRGEGDGAMSSQDLQFVAGWETRSKGDGPMLSRCPPVFRPLAYQPRSSISIIIAAVSLLFLSTTAEAAAWVRIQTEPSQPRAGEAVLIRVQSVDTRGADCLDDPDARVVPNRSAYTGVSGPALDMMEMHIHGPSAADEPVSLTLNRSDREPSIWEGWFVFPEPGRWSLQMANPS